MTNKRRTQSYHFVQCQLQSATPSGPQVTSLRKFFLERKLDVPHVNHLSTVDSGVTVGGIENSTPVSGGPVMVGYCLLPLP